MDICNDKKRYIDEVITGAISDIFEAQRHVKRCQIILEWGYAYRLNEVIDLCMQIIKQWNLGGQDAI